MSVAVDPVALRSAAGALGSCDEMLLTAGIDARRYLDTAAAAVGREDVAAAVETARTRLTELLAALSAAHAAGAAGFQAAAGAYDEVEQRARGDIELLTSTFAQAVGGWS